MISSHGGGIDKSNEIMTDWIQQKHPGPPKPLINFYFLIAFGLISGTTVPTLPRDIRSGHRESCINHGLLGRIRARPWGRRRKLWTRFWRRHRNFGLRGRSHQVILSCFWPRWDVQNRIDSNKSPSLRISYIPQGKAKSRS